MATVDVEAAGLTLSHLVDQATAGEEIIFSRNGSPVAKLVALTPATGRTPIVFGLLAGQLTAADNFDEALPEDVLAEFEGR